MQGRADRPLTEEARNKIRAMRLPAEWRGASCLSSPLSRAMETARLLGLDPTLEHLLGANPTIPPDRGLFLQYTRRMHPDVCRFVSEIVYDGRLEGIPGLEWQTTAFGTGLRFLPVEHSGNGSASSEEADLIVAEIRRMVGTPWTDRDGNARALSERDFMIVETFTAFAPDEPEQAKRLSTNPHGRD